MMKKRVLSMLLVLAMMLSMLPVIASAETQSPVIESAQLVLDSILGLNVTVALNGNSAEDYTMQVTAGDTVQTVAGNADGVFTADLMAHQMTGNIHLALMQGQTLVTEKDWNVKTDYVDKIVAGAYSDEMKALVTDMYNYGQYAAYYKGIISDPAISEVTGAADVAASNKLELRKNSAGLGAVAYLYLDEACDLGFKFNAAAMDGLTLYVDGNAVEATSVSDTQLGYKIPEILPQNYDVKHTVQVKKGEELVFDLSYSVLSYVYQWQKKNDSQYDSLKNLLKSMQVYGTAAEVYIDTLPTYLTAENAGTPALFAATINAAPDKEYILAEDLDWNGESTANHTVPAFSGTLDGQGHSITNFILGCGAVQIDEAQTGYYTCLIGNNTGTVKNLAAEYTITTQAGDGYGLVAYNNGTIDDVFVNVTQNAYAWATGTVADISWGTISNCIVVVNENTTGTPQAGGFAGMVNSYRSGSIVNCYAVSNGKTTTDNAYATCFGGLATPVYTQYADNQALLDAVEALSVEDGWASYWAITAEGITFGGQVVIAGTVEPPCEHKDEAPYDGKCDICSEAVEPDEGTVFVNMTNAGTPAAFKTLINTNPGYTYYLTEDLDWSGQVTQYQGIQTFSGVLDGQGHSIKGFSLQESGTDTGAWNSFLFGTNDGTIRNTAFDYSLPAARGDAYSLVWTNNGNLENLFVKASFGAAGGYHTAAVVDINTATGKIQNCIVEVSSTAASNSEYIGPVVYAERNGTVKNCYVVNTANSVTTAYIPAASFGSGNYTGSAVYANDQALLDAVTGFSAEDGWASYWAITAEGITFGGQVVIAGTVEPPCDHTDSYPYDGICDECKEAYTPDGITLISSANAGTPADFAALLNADPDGNFYVTEDLDWNDALFGNTYSEYTSVKAIENFSGTLDGQGHTISNFRLGHSGDAGYSTMFYANSGTIKNIGFDFTRVTENGSCNGLIAVNTGTIQNVYLKATVDAVNTNYWSGAMVGKNGGTGEIQNCIVDVTLGDSITTLTNTYVKFGAIAGVSNETANVYDCYYIATAANVTVPGIGSAWATGCAAEAVVLDETVTSLPSADGWSDCWVATENGLYFGDILVTELIKASCQHEDADSNGLCDKCGEAVAHPEANSYYINTKTAATLADFVTLINSHLDGTFYVTEDLDYSANAAITTGIGTFTGTLDGQGHSIKGIKIQSNSNDSNYPDLVGKNTGTIKDIAFVYSIEAAGARSGLINVNAGLIQNVYAKVTVNQIQVGGNWAGGFVTLNGADASTGGTIQNCIVDLTLGDSISSISQTGVVAGLNYGASTIANCYYTYTSNGVTVSGVYNDRNTTNPANVTLLSEDATVDSADGWSDCWQTKTDGIYFGDTLVIAITPACEHTDSYPYDGICDECREAYTPDGITLISSANAGTRAELAALINADPDGQYYVIEDLDYSSETTNYTGIATLEGILDGQGHTLKGLTIRYNTSASNGTNLIGVNTGTIQNIGFEYTIAQINDTMYGLITDNQGTIQNVYAKATVSVMDIGKYGSAFVGKESSNSNATIQNCIVDVTIDSAITSIGTQFGAIIGVNGSTNTIQNCYYTYTATAGITVPGHTANNSGTITNVVALSGDATVNSADGWSDCWKTDDTGLYFGSTLILAAAAKCDHEDASPVDGICDLCNETVPLPENTYLINSTSAATKAALVELINADLDGHYYLTEDLTYTAESNTGIGDFTGVLDGQGHSISGIQFKYGMINGIYDTFLFKSNTGTIQNIALEYTILLANSENFGLVAYNSGIIQNVYAKATMKAMKTDGYGSAFVGEQVKDSTAAIKNCIVDVTIDRAITSIGTQFGAIVGCNQAGTTVQNCYYTYSAVEGITVPAITDGTVNWGTVTNVKALDENATVRTADEWGSCWKMALDGIWFGNMHVLDIQVAEEAIAVYSSYSASNVSDDTIAGKGSTEDDRANIFAWYDFQKLYQEITGEAIEVVFVNSVSDLDDDRTYFILGDDLAATANLTTSGITTDNGHKIVKSGDDVYLYGKSGYGTANAMYAFLKQAFGAEFYSDTVYTTTGSTYSIDSISDATFNPAVDYNWAYDGLLYSNNGTAINYAYQMRMGFVNYWQIQGGSFHAFSELFADSDYSVDVDLNAGGTIGTSSTYVQAVADYVYEKATSGTGKSVIAVGPADTHTWSDSSASQANLSTYGANSGEYLLFMNAVMELLNTDSKYEDIPAVEVVMLVYNGSLAAPTNYSSILPNQHTERGVTLKAMFAPAEMNINVAPTDSSTKDYYDRTPSYYYGEYAKWQTIFGADNVYFWRYSTIFNEYLTPVNTVEYIQENYQALVGSDNYIKHMMDQGTGLSPVQTNYQALLVYLKGQLGKDPNADLDTLITNFCNAYYGTEAGSYIKQLLEAEQSHLNTLREKMLISDGYHYARDLSGCISMPIPSSILSQYYNLHDAKWWSANCSDDDGAMLKTWYGYITSALAATSDAEQQARIQVEAIALRYISLKAHGVALVSGDSLAQVEADAIALGITRYSEGKAIDSLA